VYRIEDYIVLAAETRKELKEKIINFSEKGFVPQGGVCVTAFNGDGEEKITFWQAISKTVKL
jgi:hypothetical protein